MEDDWELVTDASSSENLPGGLSEEDLRYFRTTFPQLSESEQPTYRAAASVSSAQGWLYLTPRHLCFSGRSLFSALASETRVVPWSQVKRLEIGRLITLGLEEEELTLYPLFSGMSGLARRVRACLQATRERTFTLVEGNERSDVVDLIMETSGSSRKAAKHVGKVERRFRSDFNLTNCELYQTYSASLMLEGKAIVGTLYLSQCLAFKADRHRLVVPLCMVASCVIRKTLLLLVLHEFPKVRYAFLIEPAQALQDAQRMVEAVRMSEQQNRRTSYPLERCIYFPIEILEKEFNPDYRALQRDRMVELNTYFKHFGRGSVGRELAEPLVLEDGRRMGGPIIQEAKRMEEFVRVGIPDAFRGTLWQLFSGADVMLARASPTYYADLIDKAESLQTSRSWREIEKDITRTFPKHPYFREEQGGLRALRSVLGAFAVSHPQLGYTQAMNFITGTLLLFMEEECAYFTLVQFVDHVAPPQMYRKAMAGALSQQRVFEWVFEAEFPQLKRHFDHYGFAVGMASSGWFLSLFLTYFPWEVCLRILDVYFFSGPHVVIRVGLALFLHNQTALHNATEMEDFLRILKDSGEQLTAEAIMSVALSLYGPRVPDAHLDELMEKAMSEVADETRMNAERDVLDRLKTRLDRNQVAAQYVRFCTALPDGTPVMALDARSLGRELDTLLPEISHIAYDRNALAVNIIGEGDLLSFEGYIRVIEPLLIKDEAREKLQACMTLWPEPNVALACFLALDPLLQTTLSVSELEIWLKGREPLIDLYDDGILNEEFYAQFTELDSDLGDFVVM